MNDKTEHCPLAIIGLGAVMPDAYDLNTFWENIQRGHDSIREVPPERWQPEDHYDSDPKADNKSYTKIGAFISDFKFNPLDFRIPPRVADSMDEVQKWAVEAARQALCDSGYDSKEFDRERCAVVIGNALAGEMHYLTTIRVHLPRFVKALKRTPEFQSLSPKGQAALLSQFEKSAGEGLPVITEDTMPGELANVIAGRVAQTFSLRGPNYTTDAACASSLAALQSAAAGLSQGRYDMVLTGGVDSSMGPQSFVKFSKIGALSAQQSCPFDARADGFVMGEGCGMMVLKRLSDAQKDGDKIYAVLHGIGSSSDGKGKGITAPNPRGQWLAVERAYKEARISPTEVGLLEAHGTSTAVGDVVEANTMSEIFSQAGAQAGSIPMGSVKSQIGHLKSAAGAASLLKAVLALHHKEIPGSLHFEQPNPKIDFASSPFFVPQTTRPWKSQRRRVAAVSSFGFGGTNFHAVLAEHQPGHGKNSEGSDSGGKGQDTMRGILTVGGPDRDHLIEALNQAARDLSAAETQNPESQKAQERIAISFSSTKERAQRIKLAQMALAKDEPGTWRAMAPQGLYRGRGKAGKVAFLFPGQGSQYINMLADLRAEEEVVANTFAQADKIMQPILKGRLSDMIFCADSQAARKALQDTTVCQPAMLTADTALARLLNQRGIKADMTAGHSLGEYAALVAAGMLSFEDSLLAVCARAKEMAGVKVEDPGKMAAVFGPSELVLKQIEGRTDVVPANFNSHNQTVLAGTSQAMDELVEKLNGAGVKAVPLAVSHAFHSFVVAPAREPLHRVLSRLNFQSPQIPVVANLDAQPYNADPAQRATNVEKLSYQVSSPVRWVQSIERLYAMGARLFIEVGPKKVLTNFVPDVLDDPQVQAVSTNHPKQGDWPSFNAALAAASASGHPRPTEAIQVKPAPASLHAISDAPSPTQVIGPKSVPDQGSQEVVVSGVSMGLPGEDHELFAEDNTERMLTGYRGIDAIPSGQRKNLAAQRIVRLVKNAPGGPAFEVIENPDEVARLTGRKGSFDLVKEFGLDPERVASFDISTRMAIGAGLMALRDAGIPLVMRHKRTTTGKSLPVGFRLPESLADETGIIFASAFPGYDELVKEMTERHRVEQVEARLAELRDLCNHIGQLHAVRDRMRELEAEIQDGFHLDRKFIFRALAMGHTQLAEQIGARGPNVQVNSACASTTLALSMASDWIQTGRCRRVLVVGADDITNPNLAPWLVGGLLATGAVTTEPKLEDAALPFDRRRNGMIPGMGAVGLLVEDQRACQRRGMQGLTRILGTVTANSAFHGTRLHPEHIAQVMDQLIGRMEKEHGLDRAQLAQETVFISHETYTPARGGSASAEVRALRQTFGPHADKIVIANTKGYTGHPMAVGIEDAAAVRMLEHQRVPPIANHREIDPELGSLNLSRGGHHPVRYALRLAAGFGSQLAITLSERIEGVPERIVDARVHQEWLDEISGQVGARLEVENKTLRVCDDGRGKAINAESAEVAEQRTEQRPEQRTEPKIEERPEENVERNTSLEIGLSEYEVKDRILTIVAEKTGYPEDMLELELDLEADLGIDTVKQAEMFSEIRAAFGIAKQDDLKLSDYPTLGHIVGFAETHMVRGEAFSAESTESVEERPSELHDLEPNLEEEEAPVPGMAFSEAEVQGKILAIVAEKTGYPEDMLELELDLEADLGIDTVKQAEMFSEIRAAFGIAKQDDLKLSDYPTLGHIVGFATAHMDSGESSKAEGTQRTEEQPSAEGSHSQLRFLRAQLVGLPPAEACRPSGARIKGQVVIAGGSNISSLALADELRALGAEPIILDAFDPQGVAQQARLRFDTGSQHELQGAFVLTDDGPLVDLDEADDQVWHKAIDSRVRLPFLLAQALAPHLTDRRGSFFVLATRMGGHLGMAAQGPQDPLAGVTTGFAKSLKREWGQTTVKAVDLPADPGAALQAKMLLAELEIDPDTVEVGCSLEGRFGISLVEETPEESGPAELDPAQRPPVVLVSGGTGGIGALVAQDLAEQKGGIYYLLSRSALPAQDDPDVTLLRQNRESLKTSLLERMRSEGARVTPVMVERELNRIERSAAALEAVEQVRRAGGQVHHAALDVTDGQATAALVEKIIKTHGRLDIILHAAGIDQSQTLDKKTPEAFDRIMGVKVDGLRSLLRATENVQLRNLVLFGSIAGRFGNMAQTDYGAGNDFLVKAAWALTRNRPDLRTVTLDYSAWADIGMAARGSVPQVMKAAGIEPIPVEAGKSSVRRALDSGLRGEWVVACDLGEMDQSGEQALADLDFYRNRLTANPQGFAMIEAVRGWTINSGMELEVVFDPERDPYLKDHCIEGTPVIPGVMAVECFAEAVRLVHPGQGVLAIENLCFETPLKLYRTEARSARLILEPCWNSSGADYRLRMETSRELQGGRVQRTCHYLAQVRVEPDRGPVQTKPLSQDPSPTEIPQEAIYQAYFHGPGFQVLERANTTEDGSLTGTLANSRKQPQLGKPARLSAWPMLTELAFQTAGLLEAQHSSQLGLPAGVERLSIHDGLPGDPGQIQAHVTKTNDNGDSRYSAKVIDQRGVVLVEVDGYRTSALPGALAEHIRAGLEPHRSDS